MTSWVVRVPASSANLGAGFDVLAMALSLRADFGIDTPPAGGVIVDEHHPGAVAYRRCGGNGAIWVRSPIPAGRGLGFSGAMRVGGALTALVERHGTDIATHGDAMAQVMRVTSELEGHCDNVAASLYGGVVVAAADSVMRVPIKFDPAIVVWLPDKASTSTDASRTRLPAMVTLADAVFNIGRCAMFVAACASGDFAALRAATQDRLHQSIRLEQVPQSAAAIDAALAAGAWAAWLSGSGPSVSMMCEPDDADALAAALPSTGHTKSLRIDHAGAVVTTDVADSDT